uniref:L27-1 domain-containing protein n=1 Tax=Anolis carolinensis TaxID=28377 RepID=A0A803TI19_ANOCA
DPARKRLFSDTRRAVEILSRYLGTLRSPAEEPLQVSLQKVLHIFQSELFQALHSTPGMLWGPFLHTPYVLKSDA